MLSNPVVILAPTSARRVVKFSWVSDGALKMPQRERERESGVACQNHAQSRFHIPSKSILRKGKASMLEMRYSEDNVTSKVNGSNLNICTVLVLRMAHRI